MSDVYVSDAVKYIGVDMQEGEIIEWKKQEGDVVNEGDILLEIMSDNTA